MTETTEALPMPMLGRDSFLKAARNFQRELVDVPEFGGRVWVREFSASECDRFSDISQRIEKEKNPALRDQLVRRRTAMVVAWCACDENGSRIFSDEDIDTIGESPYSAINRLADAIVRISGFGSITGTIAEVQGN